MAPINIAVGVVTVLSVERFRRSDLAAFWQEYRAVLVAWISLLFIFGLSAAVNGVSKSAFWSIKGQLVFVALVPMALLAQSRDLRRAFVWGLGISLGLMFIYTLMQVGLAKRMPFALHKPYNYRAAGFDNALTWAALCFSFSMVIAAEAARNAKPRLASAFVACGYIVVLALGERLYAVLATIATLVLFSNRHQWRYLVLIGLLGVGLAAYAGKYFHVGVLARYSVNSSNLSKAIAVRSDLWARATEMARDKPILGVGPGHYGRELRKLQGGPRPYAYNHAHSNWLHVLAELGLAGLGVFALFQWRILRWFWIRARSSHSYYLFVAAMYLVGGGITEATWFDSEIIIMSALLLAFRVPQKEFVYEASNNCRG